MTSSIWNQPDCRRIKLVKGCGGPFLARLYVQYIATITIGYGLAASQLELLEDG